MLKIYVLAPIVLANLAIAVLSFIIYHRLHTQGETSMAKLHLNPEETVIDFKIFLAAHSYEAVVLLAVFAAGVAGKPRIVDIGRMLSVVYAVMFASVFVRWYRRF